MALAALMAYAALLLPMAIDRHFDLTVFINAGDHYVDHSRLAAPVAYIRDSLGYDGQFFYRIAIDPFSLQKTAYGITLDSPAKRFARIGYPLLAWVAALGQIRFVPAGLLLVNLGGLAALAGGASWITRLLRLPWWLPFAIMAWPGLLIALTDDTAEIVAAAFLVGALACYASGAMRLYALLAAAATLTRETTLPIFMGVFIGEAYQAAKTGRSARSLARPALCFLALVPFCLWRQEAGFGQTIAGNPDLGWPLIGMATSLRADLDGTRHWSGDPVLNQLARLFVVSTTAGLLVFCAAITRRLPLLLHKGGAASGAALGWGLTLALMSLLTANGPWLDPHAYFRAFTETYMAGCILLAISAPTSPSHRLTVYACLLALLSGSFNWLWCQSVLP